MKDGQKLSYDILIIASGTKIVPEEIEGLAGDGWRRNIFVIGDTTDLPSSKAGSVAHFQSEILAKNIVNFIDKKPLLPEFDGHANCFIESGFGKSFLIDFNYDIDPVEGKYPIPGIGPFSLLKETRINHLGKLFFKWMYWHLALKARPTPGISATMSKAGKKIA